MKDLILISLKAQREYVINRIKSSKDKQYYSEMSFLLEKVIGSFDNYFGPLIVLEQALGGFENHALCLNKELKYKKLALKHVSEIIISVSNRFNGKLYA